MCCKNTRASCYARQTMEEARRLAIFNWRHFTPEIIVCAVRRSQDRLLVLRVNSAGAAKQLFPRAFVDPSLPRLRVINTDKSQCYPAAISKCKEEALPSRVAIIGRRNT